MYVRERLRAKSEQPRALCALAPRSSERQAQRKQACREREPQHAARGGSWGSVATEWGERYAPPLGQKRPQTGAKRPKRPHFGQEKPRKSSEAMIFKAFRAKRCRRRHQKRSFWPKQAEAEHQKRSFWRSRGRFRPVSADFEENGRKCHKMGRKRLKIDDFRPILAENEAFWLHFEAKSGRKWIFFSGSKMKFDFLFRPENWFSSSKMNFFFGFENEFQLHFGAQNGSFLDPNWASKWIKMEPKLSSKWTHFRLKMDTIFPLKWRWPLRKSGF